MVLDREHELINGAIGLIDHLSLTGAINREEAEIIDKLCAHYESLLDEKKRNADMIKLIQLRNKWAMRNE